MSFLQKLSKFGQVVKHHGGIKGALLQLVRTDDIKLGKQVGVEFGNKYFHNPEYMMGRSRWVDYSPQYGYDYDGSQIPPEWHRWLHYISDDIPTEKPLAKPAWGAEYKQNMSGTAEEYVPYSTTKPKIQAWTPPQK